MAQHDEFSEDGWTPEESALLASLPAERIPPSELKGRTIDAVRQRGLLESPGRTTSRHVLALVAAASLIFIAGALVGYAAARRAAKPVDDARVANRQEVARAVADTTPQPKRHVVWY